LINEWIILSAKIHSGKSRVGVLLPWVEPAYPKGAAVARSSDYVRCSMDLGG